MNIYGFCIAWKMLGWYRSWQALPEQSVQFCQSVLRVINRPACHWSFLCWLFLVSPFIKGSQKMCKEITFKPHLFPLSLCEPLKFGSLTHQGFQLSQGDLWNCCSSVSFNYLRIFHELKLTVIGIVEQDEAGFAFWFHRVLVRCLLAVKYRFVHQSIGDSNAEPIWLCGA